MRSLQRLERAHVLGHEAHGVAVGLVAVDDRPSLEHDEAVERGGGGGVAEQTRGARLRLMNARTRKVLEEALELPSAERGELARELLESLQDTAPPDVESAWAAVIARRAQEVLDGTAATRDLDEGLDEIESRARARAAVR
jgi:hypothetical protein